jgi:hypothetical protein
MFIVILKVVVKMMLLKYLTKEEIPSENNAYGGKKNTDLPQVTDKLLSHNAVSSTP